MSGGGAVSILLPYENQQSRAIRVFGGIDREIVSGWTFSGSSITAYNNGIGPGERSLVRFDMDFPAGAAGFQHSGENITEQPKLEALFGGGIIWTRDPAAISAGLEVQMSWGPILDKDLDNCLYQRTFTYRWLVDSVQVATLDRTQWLASNACHERVDVSLSEHGVPTEHPTLISTSFNVT